MSENIREAVLKIVIDKDVGFYDNVGQPCAFADSKQVTTSGYVLQHDLYYRSKDGCVYLVKNGFHHDGASKGFLKRFGKYTNAAILHDALYGSQKLSRRRSDKLFKEAMKVSGVPWWRRKTYWASVRMFGWFAYNKSEEECATDLKYIEVYCGEEDD